MNKVFFSSCYKLFCVKFLKKKIVETNFIKKKIFLWFFCDKVFCLKYVCRFQTVHKLDGVAPLVTDPPPTTVSQISSGFPELAPETEHLGI